MNSMTLRAFWCEYFTERREKLEVLDPTTIIKSVSIIFINLDKYWNFF